MINYPCFWVEQDNSGGWFWVYHAENAESIARSLKSYETKAACTRSISLMQHSAEATVYHV